MVEKNTSNRGFTLVEMIVATALFSIVMLVSVSTLLALVNANRKAQAIQSVMNNLNIALDSMVRAAREGAVYDGSVGCTGGAAGTDCTGGATSVSFAPRGNTAAARWVYTFVPAAGGLPGRLVKTVGGNSSTITASEVNIDYMRFYVVGTATSPDNIQPKIIMVIKGSAGVAGTDARTTFHIQATAVQRVLDI